jgi:hypothetical protein
MVAQSGYKSMSMHLEHTTSATRVGEDHTDDDQQRKKAPDPLDGFFGLFMKENTHARYFTLISRTVKGG